MFCIHCSSGIILSGSVCGWLAFWVLALSSHLNASLGGCKILSSILLFRLPERAGELSVSSWCLFSSRSTHRISLSGSFCPETRLPCIHEWVFSSFFYEPWKYRHSRLPPTLNISFSLFLNYFSPPLFLSLLLLELLWCRCRNFQIQTPRLTLSFVSPSLVPLGGFLWFGEVFWVPLFSFRNSLCISGAQWLSFLFIPAIR